LVAQQMPAYLRAAKKDKVKIARHIVSIIQSQGGRFLKRRSDATTPTTVDSASSSGEDGYWIPVTDQRAREKTSQALREGLDVRHRTFRTDHKARVMMARRSLLTQQKQKELGDKIMVGNDAASVCSSPLSLAATTTKEETHHDNNHDIKNDNPRTRPRLVKGVVLLPTDDVVHDVRRYDPYVSDDVGASSASGAGGVPDLLEEEPYEQQQHQQQHQEQFDDAPEEYSPSTIRTSQSGGGDHHHQHRQHFERLLIQFEPPRTTATTTTTAISSRNKVVVPYCV
jgi:hypothetical protein